MRRGAWACGLLAWAPCGVAGATLARDVAALEAVRDAWGSAALGSWAAGTDPCGSPGWSGVTCGASAVVDGATAVTRLEVADVARDRLWELPEAAGNLTELEWLVLNDVGLTGTFPGATLARLASVEVLSLSYNYLSGPLDDTLFLGCTKLKRLSLDWNQLEAAGPTAALPAAAAGLQALISLKLGHNLLAGALPVELAALPALTSFSVEHNALEGPLPPFGTLYTLSVSHNLGLCGDVSVAVTSGVDRSGTCLGYPCGTPPGECEQDSRGEGGDGPSPSPGVRGRGGGGDDSVDLGMGLIALSIAILVVAGGLFAWRSGLLHGIADSVPRVPGARAAMSNSETQYSLTDMLLSPGEGGFEGVESPEDE